MEETKKGLTSSMLKIIAMFTMLIDHIGATILLKLILQKNQLGIPVESSLFIPMYFIMRMIGRISFPIYCFLLVEGFCRTRNVKKYLLRLGVFAFITEIPFDLAFAATPIHMQYQNVLFTLFIGVLVMYGYRKISELSIHKGIVIGLDVLVLVLGCLLAEFMSTDYGGIGILCIMVLYLFRERKKYQILAGCIAFLWEIPALIGFLFIGFYNGEKGIKLKYVFYAFYPIHLFILYLICVYLGLGSIPSI